MRILPAKAYLQTAKGLAANIAKKEAIYPFYASLKVTARCHYGCPFCNIPKYPKKDLSTEQIIKILDNLSRSSILMTSFEGGEPLLREDIGELIDYASKCNFYFMFTSSQRNILEYPIHEYAKKIDFLQVSIDEGHNNLEMFDLLDELVKLPLDLSIQTVVTKDTVEALEEKVARCHEAGANIVVIPAAPMERATNLFPDILALEDVLVKLKKKYPATIHTPLGYFDAYRNRKCSSASLIIAPDGKLFYPCNIREEFGPTLYEEDLMSWLTSKDASDARLRMKNCENSCGWYQYYSIDSYLQMNKIGDALSPIWGKAFKKKK